MRFPDRPRVFITGGGSGLGRGFALALARDRARILVGDVNLQRAEETAQLVRAAGGEATALHCNVARREDIHAAAAALREQWGGIDVLINNAGIAAAGRMGEQTLEDWEAVVGVNMWGTIYGCHVFVPLMKAQGHGFVLNVSAAAGFTSLPEMGAYNLTKAAVVSLSETLHAELAGSGIHVTVLCPTFVKTNLMETARFSDVRQQQAAAAFFHRSSVSVAEVVDAGLQGVLRNEPMVVPQMDGALLWRVKRYLPDVYFWATRKFTGALVDFMSSQPGK